MFSLSIENLENQVKYYAALHILKEVLKLWPRQMYQTYSTTIYLASRVFKVTVWEMHASFPTAGTLRDVCRFQAVVAVLQSLHQWLDASLQEADVQEKHQP